MSNNVLLIICIVLCSLAIYLSQKDKKKALLIKEASEHMDRLIQQHEEKHAFHEQGMDRGISFGAPYEELVDVFARRCADYLNSGRDCPYPSNEQIKELIKYLKNDEIKELIKSMKNDL